MSRVLNTRQRAVLEALCDTLLPSFAEPDDPAGLFRVSARDGGAADRAESLIGSLQDPLDLTRLRLLLSALGNPVTMLVLGGRFAAFDRLDAVQRERVLQGLAHSRFAQKRAGFQALKRLIHVSFYCWPVKNGRHPAWEASGYPGPLPQPTQGLEPLPAFPVTADVTLDCDVVVAGAGAGGGVVAGLLAEAGWNVVVLDKGGNAGAGDYSQIEGDVLSRWYLDGGLIMTQTGSLPILAGSGFGGGTAINYTTSFALPPKTRAEWDRLSGLRLFESKAMQESFDRVSARLNVGTRWTTPAERDRILERGCQALGWHVDVIPRNVTDCLEGVECGFCGYGCRHNAKNSTAKTYLAAAARHGARLIPHAAVERILIDGGHARGVAAVVRGADGHVHRVTVRSRAVVAAAGAINTPALLLRSGLTNSRIGRGLRLHPGTGVAGIFPQRVEPWGGAIQTRYSDQFADLGDGYGAKFETVPLHFALPASGFGWESARQHRGDVARLANLSLVGILPRDRDPGRVVASRAGHPRVHYELSPHDVRTVRTALIGAAQLLAAAGATEVFTVHTPPVRERTAAPGWLDRFTAGIDARGYTKCRMSYITFHQMASCAMGADPRHSAVSETGQTWEVKGLYVADGSSFVTSSGVNPMITIMAIADHIARGMIERG